MFMVTSVYFFDAIDRFLFFEFLLGLSRMSMVISDIKSSLSSIGFIELLIVVTPVSTGAKETELFLLMKVTRL